MTSDAREPGGSGAGSTVEQLIDREQKYPGELQDLRAALEAARSENHGLLADLDMTERARVEALADLAQSRATAAQLRADKQRLEGAIQNEHSMLMHVEIGRVVDHEHSMMRCKHPLCLAFKHGKPAWNKAALDATEQPGINNNG